MARPLLCACRKPKEEQEALVSALTHVPVSSLWPPYPSLLET